MQCHCKNFCFVNQLEIMLCMTFKIVNVKVNQVILID